MSIATATVTTVPCGCCGNAAPRRNVSQEWGTCIACIDAGCTGIPGSDGDQLRGKCCPLVLEVDPAHDPTTRPATTSYAIRGKGQV